MQYREKPNVSWEHSSWQITFAKEWIRTIFWSVSVKDLKWPVLCSKITLLLNRITLVYYIILEVNCVNYSGENISNMELMKLRKLTQPTCICDAGTWDITWEEQQVWEKIACTCAPPCECFQFPLLSDQIFFYGHKVFILICFIIYGALTLERVEIACSVSYS